MHILAALILVVLCRQGEGSDHPLVRYETTHSAGQSVVRIYDSGRVTHVEIDTSNSQGPKMVDIASDSLDGNRLLILQQLISELEGQAKEKMRKKRNVPITLGFNEGILQVRTLEGETLTVRKVIKDETKTKWHIFYIDSPEASALLKVFIYPLQVKFLMRIKGVDDSERASLSFCQPLMNQL